MDCIQSLWRVLNGNTAIREEESILSELRNNRTRTFSGILFFKCPSAESKVKLEDNKTIKGNKLDFVKKASVLLNLDEMQCLEIFQMYLAVEYKDTPSSFNDALQNVISQQNLLIKLLHFYFSERLSCLNCLCYVLSHYKNEDHPLFAGLKKEINEMNEGDAIRHSMLNQIKAISVPDYFHISAEDENMLSGFQIKAMFSSQLRNEVRALMQTLLIYNYHFPHTSESYLQQCQLLLGQLLSNSCVMISGLSVMLAFDGLGMEHIFEHFDKDKESLDKHYLASDKMVFNKVNELYSNLPSSSTNAPLLIAWAVLRYALASTCKDQSHSRYLGQQGLKGGGVGSLLSFLQSPALQSCSVALQLSRITVYKVLATTLTIFHEDTLGDANTLAQVISEVLKEELLCLEFWDACAEKGVGVVLSSAASTFPHSYLPLTSICYSLASNTASCDRLVQFASSLSLFTSEIPKSVFNSSVVDTDVDWLYTNPAPFALTPGAEFVAKANSQCNLLGTTDNTALVQWLYDYSLFSYLDNELVYLSKWSGTTTDQHFCWRLSRSVEILKIVYKLAKHYPDVLQVLQQTVELVTVIMTKLRTDTQTHAQFTAVGLKLMSVIPYKTGWNALHKINFLPRSDSSLVVWEGLYTEILNFYERPNTTFPVTLSLLKLLKRTFKDKAFVENTQWLTEGVLVLLYVLRDVFCGIQKWRFENALVKLKMCKSILVVIARVIKIYNGTQEDRQESNAHLMSLIEEHMLPALHSGPAHHTLLNIVSWCSALNNLGIEEHVSKKVCSVVSHTLTVLSLVIKLSPPGSGLEQALVVSVGGENSNITSQLAMYTYQNKSVKVSLYATRLLTDISTTNSVSLYSALGSSTVPLSLAFVNRLSSRSQDVYIKSAILDFISAAVETQPSVTELFMSIEPHGALGENSCLHPVLDYITRSSSLPLVLVCSVYRLLYKIWHYRHTAAIAALKKTEKFWERLCKYSFEEIDLDKTVSSYHLLIRAYTFHILGNDLFYHQSSDVPSSDVTKSNGDVTVAMVTQLQERDCFLYWTKVLKRICSSVEEDMTADEEIADQDSLFLLPLSEAYLSFVRAWRSFLVVTLVVRDNDDEKLKNQITFHIAGALYNQTAKIDKRVTLKASGEFASLLTILLKHHKNTSDQPVLIKVCVQVLETATKSSHDLNHIVIIPVLASLLNVLQGLDKESKTQALKDSGSVNELVTLLCDQITSVNPNQLISLSCATLSQVIETAGSGEVWFNTIKQIIPGLVTLSEENILSSTHEVSEAVLSLILCLSNYKEGGAALQWSNVQRLLCFAQFYTVDKLEMTSQLQRLWFIVIQIVANLLETLQTKFAEDAILFASIRHDRLMCVIGSLRTDFTHVEEAELFSRLLYSLASYLDTWHLKAGHCLTDVGTILGTSLPLISHYLTTTTSSTKEGEVAGVLAMLCNFTAMLRIMTPSILDLLKEKLGVHCSSAPLLALNFCTPSLGSEGPPSYGILTGCMRGCLILLQKVDPCKSTTTPTKSDSTSKSEDSSAQKGHLLFSMENILYVLISQAQQSIMDPSMDPADIMHLKRELGMELKTILESVHRHHRRGGASQSPRLDRTLSSSSSMGNILEHPQLAFFKLGYNFVNNLLQT